jgi:gliding motility-associated-like protein
VVVNVSNLLISAINAASDTCSRAQGSITLNVTNGFGPYSYQWSNVGINSSTNQNITEGSYMVTVTDNFGCKVYDTIVLSNIPLPILSLTNILDDHCGQGIGQATINASGGTGVYSYSWNTAPNQNTSSASNLSAGSYIVYVNDGRCSDSAVVTIGNVAGPIANATYNTSGDGNVYFMDQSTGASQWFWNFGDSQTSSQQNPSNNYHDPGNYNVVLSVTDNFGCSDTTSLNIVVNGGMEIWIPNAFSPGNDGINDEFGPVASGFSKEGYEMMIFDRWGKQLFLSHDYYHRWDGTIDGEKIKSTFVFVYVIYIKNTQGKRFKYTGRITTFID